MPTTTSRGRPTVTTTIDRAEINRRNAAEVNRARRRRQGPLPIQRRQARLPGQAADPPRRGPPGLPGPPRRLDRQVRPARRRRGTTWSSAPSTPPGSSTAPTAPRSPELAERDRPAKPPGGPRRPPSWGPSSFRLPGRPLGSLPQKDGLYPEDTLISWPFDPEHRQIPGPPGRRPGGHRGGLRLAAGEVGRAGDDPRAGSELAAGRPGAGDPAAGQAAAGRDRR